MELLGGLAVSEQLQGVYPNLPGLSNRSSLPESPGLPFEQCRAVRWGSQGDRACGSLREFKDLLNLSLTSFSPACARLRMMLGDGFPPPRNPHQRVFVVTLLSQGHGLLRAEEAVVVLLSIISKTGGWNGTGMVTCSSCKEFIHYLPNF